MPEFTASDSIWASSIAGIISRSIMHPIDTMKAKKQTFVSKPPPILDLLRSTFRKTGIRGLYAGYGATALGGIPGNALYFVGYESSKQWLGSVSGLENHQHLVHFTSGCIAEAISCVLWVPIDVVKERLQVQSELPKESKTIRYKGNIHALTTIIKQQGLSGIYRGYGATIMSFGPYTGLYLAGYEQCKVQWSKYLNKKEANLPFPALLASGMFSASLAAWVTSPLDMAKLRLQIQRSNNFQYGYRHMFHGMSSILRRERIGGLWKGSAARVAFVAPYSAIIICTYDSIKLALANSRTGS